MNGYLGQTVIDKTTHPEFKDMTPNDWAMTFITMYGGIDGEHHKSWVIDQVARILRGVEVIVYEASWDNGFKEFRYSTSSVLTNDYYKFVLDCRGEWDGTEWEYDYDEGIAP